MRRSSCAEGREELRIRWYTQAPVRRGDFARRTGMMIELHKWIFETSERCLKLKARRACTDKIAFHICAGNDFIRAGHILVCPENDIRRLTE